MGWLVTAGILILLATLPLGVRIHYDEQGFAADMICGLLKVRVFPLPDWLKKKTEKKPAKETTHAAKKTPSKQITEDKKKGGSLKEFMPLIKIGIQFLGDFRRKLRLNHVCMKLILAGDDPCDVAVNYGRAWALMDSLIPQLERIFVIKKRDLEVECDFTADQITIIAGLDVTITLGRLLSLAIVYGIRMLKAFLNIKKNQESGVKHESETT